MNNKFVPLFPKSDSTDPAKSFECDPSQVTKVKGDWGAIPHASDVMIAVVPGGPRGLPT